MFKLTHQFFKRGQTSWHQLFNFAWLDNLLFKTTFLWEPKVSKFLSKQKGNLFVDVGACYGRYVILAAKKFSRIVAVEPEPHNMQTIKRNVKYSGLNNVEFAECAVADRVGYADLYLSTRSGTHRLDVLKMAKKITVKTETLESLLQNRTADLVKVDVEGAELQVLKGATNIMDNINSWIVELHSLDRKEHFEDFFNLHQYSTELLDKTHIYAWR